MRGGHRDHLAGHIGRRIAFAHAYDSLIGSDLHNERVLRTVGARGVDLTGSKDQSFDVRDLHRMTSPSFSLTSVLAASTDATRRSSGNRWAIAVMLIAPSGLDPDVRKSGRARQLMPRSLSSLSVPYPRARICMRSRCRPAAVTIVFGVRCSRGPNKLTYSSTAVLSARLYASSVLPRPVQCAGLRPPITEVI